MGGDSNKTPFTSLKGIRHIRETAGGGLFNVRRTTHHFPTGETMGNSPSFSEGGRTAAAVAIDVRV